MKKSLIIPVVFIIMFVILTLTGSFVTNWKSFLIGIIFTLSVLDIGKELISRGARR